MDRGTFSEATNSFSRSDPDETLIAEFVRRLDDASDQTALLAEYVERHPALAERFREVVRAQRILDETPAPAAPVLSRIGRHRVVRLVRRGGMGEVYEAIDEHLERRVALKLIRPDRVSPEVRLRFDREQRVLAQLHHTHIVPIYDAGSLDDLQYLVMPYVEGAALHHIVSHASFSTVHVEGDHTPTLRELAERLSILPPEKLDSPAPHKHRDEPSQPRFSRKYFESAALAMIDIADAVQAAHDIGIVHRDLKPSNVMIDSHGHAWLIDLGLARENETSAGNPDETSDDHKPAELTDGPVGTPRYMAPEQYPPYCVADARSDVWGLAAILFELLTLQAAFPGKDRRECEGLITDPSPSPRASFRNVTTPKDLDAICARALHKDRNKRYGSAGEFAADLRRYLRGEPTTARPAWAPRRVYLWARRHKGWATAMTAAALLIAALVQTRLEAQKRRASEAEASNVKVQAEANGKLAVARIRQVMDEASLSGAKAGWTTQHTATQLLELASDAATRRVVQTLATETLRGMDAKLAREFRNYGANHLGWNANGSQLLLGSAFSNDGLRAAAAWDTGGLAPKDLSVAAFGPVAYSSDGTPVQLTLEGDDQQRCVGLTLVNLTNGQTVRRFVLPEPVPTGLAVTAQLSESLSHVAVSVTTPGGFVLSEHPEAGNAALVYVWKGDSGELLHQFACEATCLALSPSGELVAAGNENGLIRIWSLLDGRELKSVTIDHQAISCLHWSRDYRRGGSQNSPGQGWLLAAGDASGTAVVWDAGLGTVRSICRGSHYDVRAVDISADGSTLVSAGLQEARIWDVASGKLLLRVPSGSSPTPVAKFSPDGKFLALGEGQGAATPTTTVWRLDYGRGIATLRGLLGQVSKLAYSADGRRVAAMSHDWRVGVWQCDGTLLGVFEVTKGFLADNAGLALSPDGKRLAFASGVSAELWDVQTAERLKQWELPKGYSEVLRYPSSDSLILARTEGAIRVRNLFAEAPIPAIPSLQNLQAVFRIDLSPDGGRLAVDGWEGSRHRTRVITLVDGSVLDIPNQSTRSAWGDMAFDPTGAYVATPIENDERTIIVDSSTGEFRGLLQSYPACLAPNVKLVALRNDGGLVALRNDGGHVILAQEEGGLELHDVATDKQLITFRVDLPTSVESRFSPDGKFLAWGNPDGTVSLCNLPEVQSRLTAIRLGWSDDGR